MLGSALFGIIVLVGGQWCRTGFHLFSSYQCLYNSRRGHLLPVSSVNEKECMIMQIKDVTKKYNGKPVVDAVNLEIPKGKVISFIGPNGAGKSTVMGIISRLIAKDSGWFLLTEQTLKNGKAKSFQSVWQF